MKEEIFNKKAKEIKQRLFLSKECKGAVGYKWLDTCKILKRNLIADKNMYDDKKEYYRHNPSVFRYRREYDNMLALCNIKTLKEEISNEHFEVFLQPKVDFDRLIIGAEALIRYRDNDGNLIMPDNFITLFENSRVISILDYYVLKKYVRLQKYG